MLCDSPLFVKTNLDSCVLLLSALGLGLVATYIFDSLCILCLEFGCVSHGPTHLGQSQGETVSAKVKLPKKCESGRTEFEGMLVEDQVQAPRFIKVMRRTGCGDKLITK